MEAKRTYYTSENRKSTADERRGFWWKMTLFTLPFAIGFIMVTGLMMYLGESLPVQIVAWTQANDEPVLYRPGYGYRDQEYKAVSVDTHQPEVMGLGSSRILQFRSHFFNENPDAFFNAGGAGWTMPEITRLLTTIEHKPEIMILTIDFPWFIDEFEGDPAVQPPSDEFERVFVVNRTFLQEVIDGKDFDWTRLLARDEPGWTDGLALGQRAIIDGHGYRNDGSEQYGDFLVAQYLWQPHMRQEHLNMLDNCEFMYACDQAFSEERWDDFLAILDYAQTHDIYVVGLLPAFAPAQWDALMSSGRHEYILDVLPRLEATFEEYGYPLFDFSDGEGLGTTTDEAYFDGWHYSELVGLWMYIHMAEEEPRLAAYSNIDALRQTATTAPDPFRVFDFIAGNDG